MYKVDAFSAIITPPQAAILAVGSISDRVVPVEGKPVSAMMTMTLSSDHRVWRSPGGRVFERVGERHSRAREGAVAVAFTKNPGREKNTSRAAQLPAPTMTPSNSRKKAFYTNSSVQVLFGIGAAIALANLQPATAIAMKPLAMRLSTVITMIVTLIIFCTVVTGIAMAVAGCR